MIRRSLLSTSSNLLLHVPRMWAGILSFICRAAQASVNRKLGALTSFCEFHARHGVRLAGLLMSMQPAGRGRYSATSVKPFRDHISKSGPQRHQTIKLTAPTRWPRVLTAPEVQTILDACERL